MSANTEDRLLFDAWTALSHKRPLSSKPVPGISYTQPTWVGEHGRRLQAYSILQAYIDNAAREFLNTTDESIINNHREYGDAALIVNQVTAALLGDEQTLVVDGADEDPDAEGADAEGISRALALQEWLQAWADKERLPLKMLESERNAVGLGDAVYSLGWSADKRRVRLRCWDPGFYFPVLSDGNEDDFPSKVHIAWEFKDPEDEARRLLRRITWQLAPIGPQPDPSDPDRVMLDQAGQPVLREGDALDERGRIVRTYAWNDQPTNLTCYFTDAVWTLDAGGKTSIHDLTDATARYMTDEDGREIRNLDLRLDFIPVVHEPNTVSLLQHYGRSILLSVAQILDDISNADSDLNKASGTAGSPIMALVGAKLTGTTREVGSKPTEEQIVRGAAGVSTTVALRPGTVLQLPAGGDLKVMSTADALDALLKYLDSLLERLSVNARTPASVLGRIKPSEVPSGVALLLSFGPLRAMIAEMRLVRREKYPLLMRFVQRIAASAGDPDVPGVWDRQADIVLGSYLPANVGETVEHVTKLLGTKGGRPAISRELAIQMLVEAGLPIEDAAAEVERIEHEDFDGGADLMAVVGVEQAAEYLGREAPEQPDVLPPDPANDPDAEPDAEPDGQDPLEDDE